MNVYHSCVICVICLLWVCHQWSHNAFWNSYIIGDHITESKRGAFSRFPLCNIYSYSSQAILQARLTLKSDAAYVAILRIKWHFKSSTQCDVRQVREIQFHLFSDVMCSCCACITFVLSFSSYVKLGLISRWYLHRALPVFPGARKKALDFRQL